jgi:biotin synthase-related radical SAM superfamily protein
LTDSIGVSSGTLTILGLTNARSLEKPTTAHFMLGEDCIHSCKFCSQAKCSTSLPNHLSRVTWPKRDWTDIAAPLSTAITAGTVKRACLQVVESPGAVRLSVQLLGRIRAIQKTFPISVCAAPTSVSRVELFMEAGASRVGLPVDAASRRIFGTIKGRRFDRSWEVLRKASQKWPGRISTHLIAGLGETEEEIVRSISMATELGITVALFAFTPVKGTQMEKEQPPSLASYRRIQLAAFFLSRGGNIDKVRFEGGRIAHIHISNPEILDEIKKGVPFQTSGCSYCNRPYYNERPGRIHMNYPRALSEKEALRCLLDSKLDHARVLKEYES